MNFFPSDNADLLQAALGAILGYIAIVIAVRLTGLRSFAKMASHDFAVTVAIGSVLASAALASSTPLAVPLLAVVVLFLLQYLTSRLLSRSEVFSKVTQNAPLLIMDGEKVLHENLRKSSVSEAELRGKLREANVTKLDEVLAVVFETTGDISVLHASSDITLDDYLLEGVKR